MGPTMMVTTLSPTMGATLEPTDMVGNETNTTEQGPIVIIRPTPGGGGDPNAPVAPVPTAPVNPTAPVVVPDDRQGKDDSSGKTSAGDGRSDDDSSGKKTSGGKKEQGSKSSGGKKEQGTKSSGGKKEKGSKSTTKSANSKARRL